MNSIGRFRLWCLKISVNAMGSRVNVPDFEVFRIDPRKAGPLGVHFCSGLICLDKRIDQSLERTRKGCLELKGLMQPTETWKDGRACERYPILIFRALEANLADGVRLRLSWGRGQWLRAANQLESML